MTDSIPELAAELDPADAAPAMSMRVGIATAVEVGGSRRIQVDIAGGTWLNRLQDTQIAAGDRVSILQQGPVMLVIGRLQGTDGFIPIAGILPWAGGFLPANWLYCDGSAVSRSTYSVLFFQCGTTYGAGNGTTTFNLPNMANRFPLGESLSHFRGTTGDGNFSLASGNLPSHAHGIGSGTVNISGSHSHSVPAGGAAAVFAGAGGDFAANDDTGGTGSAGSHGHTLSGATDAVGSGTAFQHFPPFLSLQYIIRAL